MLMVAGQNYAHMQDRTSALINYHHLKAGSSELSSILLQDKLFHLRLTKAYHAHCTQDHIPSFTAYDYKDMCQVVLMHVLGTDMHGAVTLTMAHMFCGRSKTVMRSV